MQPGGIFTVTTDSLNSSGKKGTGADSAARHFGRSALFYERHAEVQRRLARRVVGLLVGAALQPERILEIGCGTGYLTGQLAALYPGAWICALDPAAASIELARSKLKALQSARIEFVSADYRTFVPAAPFDLIVSSSALQWIPPLPNTIGRIASQLRAGGHAVAAVIAAGTFDELHASRRAAAPLKPPRRDLPGVEELDLFFRQAGFSWVTSSCLRYHSAFSDPCALIEYARALGFTGGDLSSSQLPLNRSELRAVIEYYRRHFSVEGPGFEQLAGKSEFVEIAAEIPQSMFRSAAVLESSSPGADSQRSNSSADRPDLTTGRFGAAAVPAVYAQTVAGLFSAIRA